MNYPPLLPYHFFYLLSKSSVNLVMSHLQYTFKNGQTLLTSLINGFSISLQIHTKSMTTLDVKCIPVVEITIVPVWKCES